MSDKNAVQQHHTCHAHLSSSFPLRGIHLYDTQKPMIIARIDAIHSPQKSAQIRLQRKIGIASDHLVIRSPRRIGAVSRPLD